MYGNILRCLVVCILCIRIIQGSPAFGTEDSIRQAKIEEKLKYLNESIDPCDNFYEFACGNYATFNPVLSDTPFRTLDLAQQSKLKSMLTSGNDAGTDFGKKIIRFYKSCLNLPSLGNIYGDKLKQIINEFGQMPALEGDTWREDDFDWLRTVAKIAFKYDKYILLNVGVARDMADKSLHSIYIIQPAMEFPKSAYTPEKPVGDAYLYRLKNFRTLNSILGLDDELANEIIRSNWNLEKHLAKNMQDAQTVASFADYKLSSIDEIHQRYSDSLNIKELINITMGSVPNLMVYSDTGLLENLIDAMKVFPKKAVANYIFSKLIDEFAFFWSSEELEKICIHNMRKYFSEHMVHMVYRQYHTKATEQGIYGMWMDIKSIFKNSLETPTRLDWISEDTRKYAVKKLDAMQLRFLTFEENNFDEELDPLNVDDKDFVENLKSIMSLRAAIERDKDYDVTKPVDFEQKELQMASLMQWENTVMVPLNLLEPNVMWSASFPNAINYGGLGFILSHELIHGFDGHGRAYDTQGNNLGWWDEISIGEFNVREKCIRNQYKQYSAFGQHLAEMANQGENIADNGGVRLAYETYLQWYSNDVATQHNLKSLDGSKTYDYKQLYFISFAQLWCGNYSPDYVLQQLASDAHAPDNLRVIGTLSNSKEFSSVFNCPVGSPMNPVTKCEIY